MTEIMPIRRKYSIEVLSTQQLKEIRAGTLHLLEHIGVHFPSQRALRVFTEHGAHVDMKTNIVRMPTDLVLDAMGNAPRSFTLSGRAEGTDLSLDGSSSYFGTDGTGNETLDLGTGAHRPSSKDDVARMAHVVDHLSSLAFYWPMVSAQDYGSLAPLHELDASFNNTTKHVQTETVMGERPAQYAVRMAEVISGDLERMQTKPPLSGVVCTIAPLGQDKEGIEGAMVFAGTGIPIGFMSMPTIGSSAPATMGGALAVGNAEIVSAMVLMQLVSPGAPVFYSLCASVMDPRSGEYIVSIPEKYLCNTAAVQLAHDWGVPALAGVFSMDSPEPGTWQLGRDSVYTALMGALAGAELAEGLGMLQASTLLVPEQIIFDDEIYHTHRLIAEGIDTSDEGLALEVIGAVGPRGHFLGQKHTRKHVRQIWLPGLTHPGPSPKGESWPRIRKRARARLERILAEHEPEPLDKIARSELQAILNSASRDLIA